MLMRAIRFSPPVIAAVLMCGCGSEHAYNTPSDESKEAAAIAAGAAQVKGSAARKKITKPPGAPLKAAKNTQPLD